MGCIFCKIANGEITKKFDYEDDNIMVFADINPVRSVHMLLVPKKHFEDIYDLDDPNVLLSMHKGVKRIVDNKKLLGRGFRIVTNGGGAQLINHLHFHLISPVKSDASL
jgi:histidine triad (HIT) family protein